MRISKRQTRLSIVFALTQVGVGVGCNAILGNGYGVDDSDAAAMDGDASSADGSPLGDALAADGMSSDGTTSVDGMAMDGGAGDAGHPDSGFDSGCPNEVCPTKLTDVVGPERIAVSPGVGVYWVTALAAGFVNFAGAGIKGATLSGTIATGLRRGVTVNGGIPFVTSPDSGGHGIGVCAADLSGTCTPFIGSAGSPSSLTTDGTNIFLGLNEDSTNLQGGIWRMAPNGTGQTSYSPMNNAMTDHVLDLQIVSTATYSRTLQGINVNTATTAPVTVADLGGDAPAAFVVHGTSLLVATTNSHIRGCTLSSQVCLAATDLRQLVGPNLSAITTDGVNIYWAEGTTSGTIHRCDFPSCVTQTVIANGQLTPTDLAIDGSELYWANFGDVVSGAGGAIMKLPK